MGIPNNNLPSTKISKFACSEVQLPSGAKQYIPRIIDLTPDDFGQHSKKSRRIIFLLPLLILLIIVLIATAIVVPILLSQRNSTTTTNSSSIFTAIAITKTTTTTTTAKTTTATTTIATRTSTTTAVNCISPFALAPFGICVNTMIDINNCGTVGKICPANYSSCSAGVCSTAPGVKLANATVIWSSALNGSADDEMYSVTLPWSITLYNTTTNRVTVTTAGVLCLGDCATTYTETTLPASDFSGATALPFWDDLYIYENTSQGIYYESDGNAFNRTLTFEYYMSHYLEPNQYYHFQAIFFEAAPGLVQYKYFDASDGGQTCTVGVQASNNGPFIQYSYDRANSVRPNMTLTFDTNLGTYTSSSIG